MKRKRLFFICLIIIVICSIITMGIGVKINKESDNKVTIETYIDGVLAAAPPSSTDGYKVSSISCSNGATGTFNYSTWRLEVTNVTSNTLCTLEFVSNDNTTLATYLKSKVCASTPTSDDAAKDCLVNENGYRYEGSNPNNYVLFNDELWRIIGVFTVTNSSGASEDLVKLIRNETLDGLAWDGPETNDWSVATLQTQLNNGYLNATDTTCNIYSTSVTKTCYFSETGLNSTSREMIESVVWNLGGYSSASVTSDTMYEYERGTTVYSGRPTTWTGKVALMYPSDYGYAVLASSCARTTNLSSYITTACAGNDWLKTGSYQWTLTPLSSNSTSVFYVYNFGYLSYRNANYGYGARPSFYLKSSVHYMDGDGSRSNPYKVS